MTRNPISSFFTKGDTLSLAVKRNIFASFLLKGCSLPVTFILIPLTIGYVSKELYGVWLTLSSILTWIGFLDIGFSQGLKNRLVEAIARQDWEKGKSLVSTTYFAMLMIFIPVCIITWILIPHIDWCKLLNISSRYSEEITKCLYVLITMASLQMIVNVLVSVIAAFQKVALSNTFIPLGNIISLIIIYILTKTCQPSLVYLALSLAAMPILVTIIASVILYTGQFKNVAPAFHRIKMCYIKDLCSLGYKFFIINVQAVIVFQSTNILISHVSSPTEVTTYNIAYSLLGIAMMAYNIITNPLWPAYTDAYTRKDYMWMKNVRSKMTKVLLISIGICGLITLASPVIYKIWIGDKVEVPYLMTFLVAVYVSINCWMNLNGTLIVGMGKLYIDTIMVVIGMLLHLPLSFFLGKYIGAYGVLTSLIAINVVYGVVLNIQANRLLNKTARGIWNR